MAKCQWAMAECTYLGHVVGGGYVKPVINKLEAVETSQSQKQRRRSGHVSLQSMLPWQFHQLI